MNWAEQILAPGADADVAIVATSDTGASRVVTRGEVRAMTARVAAGLRACGVGPGDAVVAYVPNVPEAVAALLACASIRALFSSCSPGWVMWNFLIGALMTGASIVLHDGSPSHPNLYRLWEIAGEWQVTCFGTSAGFISACRKASVRPRSRHNLERLRSVGSTGSPLSPEGFDWVHDELGSPWLFSLSGGSDLCTAFVGGCSLLPVYRGELQSRALGAAVEAWDDAGRPVTDAVGELVITAPMPSMPLALVDDPTGARYRDAYFSMWPGVWRHGDWLTLTSRGTAIIHGRSDATINRGGVRMGTAEIYAAVLSRPELREALVVDVPQPGADGSRLHLFVVLVDGVVLDENLRKAICHAISDQCSPRHIPDEIHAAPDLPRTLSGKIVEVPVKRILSGEAPARAASVGALANPAALEWFASFSQARPAKAAT